MSIQPTSYKQWFRIYGNFWFLALFGPFWPENAILGLSVAQIGKSCKEHYDKLDPSDQNEHSTYFIRPVVHEIW